MSNEKDILCNIEDIIHEKYNKKEIISLLKDTVDFFCDEENKNNIIAMDFIRKFVLQNITREDDKRRRVFMLTCKLIDLKTKGKSTTFIDYMEEIEYNLNGSGRSFWAKA